MCLLPCLVKYFKWMLKVGWYKYGMEWNLHKEDDDLGDKKGDVVT